MIYRPEWYEKKNYPYTRTQAVSKNTRLVSKKGDTTPTLVNTSEFFWRVSISFVTDTLSEWPYRNGRSILQALSKSLNSYKQHILGAFFSGEVFSQQVVLLYSS